MSEMCQMVVFSNKAYNAIIRESFDKDPDETGGILLGHILDNGVWIVMEVLPPGIQCIFERAYFEYDDAFVNYLAQSVANQYRVPLDLLGLWHRHPGSMDVFSTTDDGTNASFARQNRNGVISGLVNIDPRFRLTMYHMDCPAGEETGWRRPYYEKVDVEVGDDIIPKEYFELRYYDGEASNLHPEVDPARARVSRQAQTGGRRVEPPPPPGEDEWAEENGRRWEENEDEPRFPIGDGWPKHTYKEDCKTIGKLLERHAGKNLLVLAVIVCAVYGGVKAVERVREVPIVRRVLGYDPPSLTDTQISLRVGKSQRLEVKNVTEEQRGQLRWISSERGVASVDSVGNVTGRKAGVAEVSVQLKGKRIGSCRVEVKGRKQLELRDVLSLSVAGADTVFVMGNELEWSSGNDSVARVENGIVRGVRAGMTEVKALVEDMEVVWRVVVRDSATVSKDSVETDGLDLKGEEYED